MERERIRLRKQRLRKQRLEKIRWQKRWDIGLSVFGTSLLALLGLPLVDEFLKFLNNKEIDVWIAESVAAILRVLVVIICVLNVFAILLREHPKWRNAEFTENVLSSANSYWFGFFALIMYLIVQLDKVFNLPLGAWGAILILILVIPITFIFCCICDDK